MTIYTFTYKIKDTANVFTIEAESTHLMYAALRNKGINVNNINYIVRYDVDQDTIEGVIGEKAKEFILEIFLDAIRRSERMKRELRLDLLYKEFRVTYNWSFRGPIRKSYGWNKSTKTIKAKDANHARNMFVNMALTSSIIYDYKSIEIEEVK